MSRNVFSTEILQFSSSEFHVLKLSCDGFMSFIQVQQSIDLQ